MKYLGIDYGTKKIGLALSDDAGSVAFPHAVVPNDQNFLTDVRELIAEKEVGAVVMGHSLTLKGEENSVMKDIHTCKEAFEGAGITVHLEPEYFTSVQAKRNTEDALADASAAALILQSFLDKEASSD